MSFLFNSFNPVDLSEDRGEKWSDIVAKAKEAGFTEPDPRDDLSGMDVARKLTILGRLAGLKIKGPDSFPVQSLIPKALESAKDADEFMRKLPEYDSEMEEYKKKAAAAGNVVRYVGSIDFKTQEVKVALEMVAKDSAIGGMKGSGNMVSFQTERYPDPLTVQGAGAGGAVTAAGVAGDLIKSIQRLQGPA